MNITVSPTEETVDNIAKSEVAKTVLDILIDQPYIELRNSTVSHILDQITEEYMNSDVSGLDSEARDQYYAKCREIESEMYDFCSFLYYMELLSEDDMAWHTTYNREPESVSYFKRLRAICDS